MPTYEFRCPNGHEFEKFYRTISGAESEAVCPVCGKAAERFMSAAGFAFKGSGFYLTDYGKNAHRGEAPPKLGDSSSDSASKESSSATSDGGSSSSDSKSASSGDSTKSADTSGSAAKPEKKAEPKAAESKPAKAPPKPSSGE